MKEIMVNSNCKIDNNYFAKSREDSLNVAINITSSEALKGNECKGFINFTFGFNKDEDVLENYTLKELEDICITNIDGYGWFKLKKFDENDVFISKIKILENKDIPFDILKDMNERIFKSKTYYFGDYDRKNFEKAIKENNIKFLPYKLKNLNNDNFYYDECIILIGIYDKNNELIAISYVYNHHNSCYTHIVEVNHNGDIEVIEYL